MTAIIVHGGAWNIPEAMQVSARASCMRAAEQAHALLESGASALDAVEAAVQLLEEDPQFDAGRGSYPNLDGEIEMDAIVADGATLAFGAVAAIRNVLHPVSVARRVMEASPHGMLVGEGAIRFARAQGFPSVPTERLRAPAQGGGESACGTVGAAALDARGNVAAATSTGGTPRKMPGRVGDSPLIGCGALADNEAGAASATGHGESLMRIQMARTTLDVLRSGAGPMMAARQAVDLLASRTQGRGGVICLAPDGQVGYAWSTANLALAYVDGHGRRHAQV